MKSFADQKRAVALLSVLSNTTLVVFKLIVGLLIGSISVISEAIHSAVDLVAALIALVAVRMAARAPNKQYPFGHGKVENVSGTIEALLIFLAAGWIVYEACEKLLHPRPLGTLGWGVLVMLISALANYGISSMLFKVGQRTESVALQADAWHLRTDVYTSAGVMLGLTIISVGSIVAPGVNLDWVDPVAAILVAILIIQAAYHLTVESALDLLDVSLPSEEVRRIRRRILAYAPQVRGLHDLKTRKSGSDRFAEFHIVVDSELPTRESHWITDQITTNIRRDFSSMTVTIHVEPCEKKCTPKCLGGCLDKNGAGDSRRPGVDPETEGETREPGEPGSRRFRKPTRETALDWDPDDASPDDPVDHAPGPTREPRDAPGAPEPTPSFSIRTSTETLLRGVLFLSGRVVESLVSLYQCLFEIDHKIVADYHKAKAQEYIDTGRAKLAVPILKKAFSTNRSDLDTRMLLAKALRAANQTEEAQAHLEAILAEMPHSERTLRVLGFIHFRRKEYEKAIGYLERAIRLDPANAMAFYRLGLAYEGQGRVREAIEAFRKTTELLPTFAKAYHAIGLCHAGLGEKEASVSWLKRAVELKHEPKKPTHALDALAIG